MKKAIALLFLCLFVSPCHGEPKSKRCPPGTEPFYTYDGYSPTMRAGRHIWFCAKFAPKNQPDERTKAAHAGTDTNPHSFYSIFTQLQGSDSTETTTSLELDRPDGKPILSCKRTPNGTAYACVLQKDETLDDVMNAVIELLDVERSSK